MNEETKGTFRAVMGLGGLLIGILALVIVALYSQVQDLQAQVNGVQRYANWAYGESTRATSAVRSTVSDVDCRLWAIEDLEERRAAAQQVKFNLDDVPMLPNVVADAGAK